MCILLLCLLLSYFLCRFAFFPFHGMKQWPDILAAAGLVVLLISFALKLHWVSMTAAFGYILGFGLGAIFNTDGVDQGGGATNNLWIIWTASYLLFILAGTALDAAAKRKRKEE